MVEARGAAVALVLVFNASVTALIHLYVVGVFVAFTVCQLGMIKHWNKLLRVEQDPAVRRRFRRSQTINAIGLFVGALIGVSQLTSVKADEDGQ